MENKATHIILGLIIIGLVLYIIFFKKKSDCNNIGVEINRTDYPNKKVWYKMNVDNYIIKGVWDASTKEQVSHFGSYSSYIGALADDNTATFKIMKGDINVMGAVVDFNNHSIQTF